MRETQHRQDGHTISEQALEIRELKKEAEESSAKIAKIMDISIQMETFLRNNGLYNKFLAELQEGHIDLASASFGGRDGK